jgi:geranylgeranyl reductase family protein
VLSLFFVLIGEVSLEQPAIQTLPRRLWDVVIIGAGPAGSVCAGILADKGHQVLIIEKERFPRLKPCGDLLIADSIAMLERIGLWEEIKRMAHEIPAMEMHSPSGARITITGAFYSIGRQKLDAALVINACRRRQRGSVSFSHGAVMNIKTNGAEKAAELYCSQSTEPMQAKVVVLATGSVTTLAYRLGLVQNRKPSALALRGYVPSRHCLENAIISYDRSSLPGYRWIIPLGKDSNGLWTYNVGCGAPSSVIHSSRRRLKDALFSFMTEFPAARTLIHQGEAPAQIGTAPLRYGLTDPSTAWKENVLAVGEVIGTTYPFSGEGIGKAMESGYIAANVIHDALQADDLSLLSRYPTQLETQLKPRYAGYFKAEKWFARPWLNDFIIKRIAKSTFLQKKVQDFFAELVAPQAVVSVWRLVQSYWK